MTPFNSCSKRKRVKSFIFRRAYDHQEKKYNIRKFKTPQLLVNNK